MTFETAYLCDATNNEKLKHYVSLILSSFVSISGYQTQCPTINQHIQNFRVI